MEKELYWLLKYEDSIARFVEIYSQKKYLEYHKEDIPIFFVKLCLDKLRNSSFFQSQKEYKVSTPTLVSFLKKNITRKMNILMESYD